MKLTSVAALMACFRNLETENGPEHVTREHVTLRHEA